MTGFADRCRAAAAAGHTRVPFTRAVVLDADTPVSAFAKVHRGEFGFLLESLEGGERWARYSFLATEPSAVFRYQRGVVEQRASYGEWNTLAAIGPLDHLGELLRGERCAPAADLPRFTGGAVGFWGYDVIRSIEDLPDPPPDDRDLPDGVVMLVDTLLVLDHLFHRAVVVVSVPVAPDLTDAELDARADAASRRADEWLARLGDPGSLAPLIARETAVVAGRAARYADSDYLRDVARCKEYIAAGDAFQIVLSRRST